MGGAAPPGTKEGSPPAWEGSPKAWSAQQQAKPQQQPTDADPTWAVPEAGAMSDPYGLIAARTAAKSTPAAKTVKKGEEADKFVTGSGPNGVRVAPEMKCVGVDGKPSYCSAQGATRESPARRQEGVALASSPAGNGNEAGATQTHGGPSCVLTGCEHGSESASENWPDGRNACPCPCPCEVDENTNQNLDDRVSPSPPPATLPALDLVSEEEEEAPSRSMTAEDAYLAAQQRSHEDEDFAEPPQQQQADQQAEETRYALVAALDAQNATELLDLRAQLDAARAASSVAKQELANATAVLAVGANTTAMTAAWLNSTAALVGGTDSPLFRFLQSQEKNKTKDHNVTTTKKERKEEAKKEAKKEAEGEDEDEVLTRSHIDLIVNAYLEGPHDEAAATVAGGEDVAAGAVSGGSTTDAAVAPSDEEVDELWREVADLWAGKGFPRVRAAGLGSEGSTGSTSGSEDTSVDSERLRQVEDGSEDTGEGGQFLEDDESYISAATMILDTPF